MEVFETLRNRFIASTSSTIDRVGRSMVHIGTSAGTASQFFYFQERNIFMDSETVYVGDEVWDVVGDLSLCGSDDKCLEINYASSRFGVSESRPVISFGDGTNGKIPVSGAQIRADYTAGEFVVSDYELSVLFMNSIMPVVNDFGTSVSVTSFSPESPSLVIEFTDQNCLEYILIRTRFEYELRRLDSFDSIYYKTHSMVIDGKQVAKSQKDAVEIMKANYKQLVRDVRKRGQTVRFSTVASVFESEVE